MQKSEQPLVSIIMNCRNGEKYLDESLCSILKQNYNNWELIFFDNNSNDKSLNIITKIKDRRIKIFKSNRTLKLYKARNLALSKIKGKYVCFLDVDDIWEKNKLTTQIFQAQSHDCKIFYSNYKVLDEKLKKKYLKYKKINKSGKITKELLKKYTVGIPTVLVESSIFKKYKFNTRYNIIGDFDFFLNLSKNYKIFYSPKPLVIYRIHENNFSKKINVFVNELEFWIKKNRFKYKDYGSLVWQKYYLLKLKIKLFFIRILGV